MAHPDIPDFYAKLLNAAGSATLSVLSADGSIQSTLVWHDYDGSCVRLNMLADAPKARNLRREQQATLLVAHPDNDDHYISLRCTVNGMTREGALAHLDQLTYRNLGLRRWYGDVEPADCPSRTQRVIVHLRPLRVYCTPEPGTPGQR